MYWITPLLYGVFGDRQGVIVPLATGVLDPGVAEFVPRPCSRYIVTEFPALTALKGTNGGSWSACTHLRLYGFNLAYWFVRQLTYGLSPSTVLELGCGLGTTSDFLARFVPGGAKVICVEPEPMLAEVFDRATFPTRAIQLAMNTFATTTSACSDALFSPSMGFDLVLSLEVAEHLTPEQQSSLVRRLTAATAKYLVFSAAREGQGGTGHVEGSMHSADWWKSQFTPGLQYLPGLTTLLRRLAYQERSYDLYANVLAFGRNAPDVYAAHPLAWNCNVFPSGICKQGNIRKQNSFGKAGDVNVAELRKSWMTGITMALWPEVDLLVRGNMRCT